MKRLTIVGAIAAVGLAGCNKTADGPYADAGHHGRYTGVGIYPAGQMWSRIAVSGSPKDPAVSRLNDDEQVIVVVDTNTGELRQCGNLSGFCIGMNPWTGPLASAKIAPIPIEAC